VANTLIGSNTAFGGSNGNATSIQGIPVDPTTPQDGYTLVYNGTEWVPVIQMSGSFTAGGDLGGTDTVQQVLSISGNAGIAGISATTLNFLASILSPTIKQAAISTPSTIGQTLTLRAQDSTGTSSRGGNIVLSSGLGPTDGSIDLEISGTIVGILNSNRFYKSVGDNNNTRVVSSNYSMNDNDQVILILGETSNVTVILPNPSGLAVGDVFSVKDASGLANTYTLTVSGGGFNIDGNTTYILNNQFESIDIIFNGSYFNII